MACVSEACVDIGGLLFLFPSHNFVEFTAFMHVTHYCKIERLKIVYVCNGFNISWCQCLKARIESWFFSDLPLQHDEQELFQLSRD